MTPAALLACLLALVVLALAAPQVSVAAVDASAGAFLQPELVEVGALADAFHPHLSQASPAASADAGSDEPTLHLVETAAESLVPSPGSPCGSGLAGKCTAQRAWCPAPKVIQTGLCKDDTFCCMPAGTSSSSAPAAASSSDPTASMSHTIRPLDLLAQAGDECGVDQMGVCTRRTQWCPSPKRIVSYCGDESYCCMPPANGQSTAPVVVKPSTGPAPVAGGTRYTYNSATGLFTFPNKQTVSCYSGRVTGYVNNPAREGVRASCQSGPQCDTTPAGPIPRGTYLITSVNHTGPRGPWTWTLEPLFDTPNNRGDFRIHGANSRDQPAAGRLVSSTGCIIMPVALRSTIQVGTLIVY